MAAAPAAGPDGAAGAAGAAGQAGSRGPGGPATAGLRLRPEPGLRSLNEGTVLLGGYPHRMLRLGPAGARHVAGWWAGEPVAGSPGAQGLARRLLETGIALPVPSGGPGPEDVTVVIPVRDRTTELAQCLSGLGLNGVGFNRLGLDGLGLDGRDRRDRRGYQVLVVDDGSLDPAAVAAVAAAAGAACLHRPVNGGPAAARNTGLAAVSTPLAAFLDSDCVPAPDWLDGLLPHFADPVVAAVAPRIVPYEPDGPAEPRPARPAAKWPSPRRHPAGWLASDRLVPGSPAPGWLAPGWLAPGWLAQYEGVSSTLDMGAVPSIVRPGAKVSYVPGAALVLRTEAARAADGFAEHMPVGEDVDLVWRLAAGGWQVRYEPAATVAHQHRVRLASWFARRMDYGTSAAPLELRHPGTLPAVAMSGWTAAAWAAAVLGSPLGVRVIGPAAERAAVSVIGRVAGPVFGPLTRPVTGLVVGRVIGLTAGPVVGAAITATATALLARRLAPLTGEQTWPVATRLAAGGTVAAGRLLGSTLSRAWWPVALPVAVAVPRLRLPLAALALAPPVLGWAERRPPMDPVRYVSARLLDDVAYSLGVWRGCLRHRTARPLLPKLTWRAR